MADKRRSSKQRRQARNRAQRDALAARTEAASKSPAIASRTKTGSGSSTGPTGSTHGSGSTSPSGGSGASTVGGAGGRGTWTRGRRRPGDLAMTVALALAIVASALLPFVPVPVDDRGEALPTQFRGLTLEVRSMLTGETVEAQNETLFSVAGPAVILSMILPLLVVGGAFWINRTREQRSRPLTIAMVLMAVVVAFGTGGGQIFYLGSLIALAVASFQVRKYELPARTAEKIAPPDDGDEVIDVDEVETDEERALAELEQELRHETDVSEGGNGAKRR